MFGSGEDDPKGEFGIFLLKLMEIIEKKSLNCESIVLGFRQCLGGVYTNILVNFRCTRGCILGRPTLNW